MLQCRRHPGSPSVAIIALLAFAFSIDPAEFVVEYTELPCIHDLILPSQLDASLFRGPPNTPVLALRVRFQEIK